ncbi:MAG: ThuA domain-containing protein [Kiritimatiellae bacterium]|nr:ThuA domain-containing protein [Kiritimatiellia bacterium]
MNAITTRIQNLIFAMSLAVLTAPAAEPPRVLIYTRNGKGYVHGNITSCVEALTTVCRDAGLATDVTDDWSIFAPGRLDRYRAIVFANTNNEAFENDAQREVFRAFIRAGGGFVGIHSATGSERQWRWYWALIGGTFAWHHPLQTFRVRVVDRAHPATSFLPDPWEWKDEFYYVNERNPNVRVLLAGEQASLAKPGKVPDRVTDRPEPYPLAWCHEFEGGRSFYTALGHLNEHYADPLFRRHLLEAIRWAARLER